MLYMDEDYGVRINLSANISTTKKALDYLAKDEMPMVRLNVAKNPITSLETLRWLADDKDKDIRNYAMCRLIGLK